MRRRFLKLMGGVLSIFISLSIIEGTIWAKKKPAHPTAKSDKKVMRILCVVGKFPWYTKQVIINQVTGLLDRGHDVYVYAKKQIPNYHVSDSLKKYLAHRVYYEKLPPDLHTYDIIIFQYGDLGEEFFGLRKKLNLKAKLVTFFRGGDVASPRENNKYAALFKEGDLFLSACGYYKYRLALLGCDPKKIVVQHSGIDCSKFNLKKREFPPKGTINIISVGRLTEKKGFFYTIEAIASLIKEYPTIKYTIIGDGPERKRIEQQVEELKIADKVKLLGWRPQDEIMKLLYNAHIFLAPSITTKKGNKDGAINALKEAMLTGVPVIGSYHGGIIEIIDQNVSGLLVPERNVLTLIESIKYLLNNPKKCQEMGITGREKIKRLFDMEKLNNQLEKLLLYLLRGVK